MNEIPDTFIRITSLSYYFILFQKSISTNHKLEHKTSHKIKMSYQNTTSEQNNQDDITKYHIPTPEELSTYFNFEKNDEIVVLNSISRPDKKLLQSIYNKTIPQVQLCKMMRDHHTPCCDITYINPVNIKQMEKKFPNEDIISPTSELYPTDTNENDSILSLNTTDDCTKSQNIPLDYDTTITISSDTSTDVTFDEDGIPPFLDNSISDTITISSDTDTLTQIHSDTDTSVESMLQENIPALHPYSRGENKHDKIPYYFHDWKDCDIIHMIDDIKYVTSSEDTSPEHPYYTEE